MGSPAGEGFLEGWAPGARRQGLEDDTAESTEAVILEGSYQMGRDASLSGNMCSGCCRPCPHWQSPRQPRGSVLGCSYCVWSGSTLSGSRACRALLCREDRAPGWLGRGDEPLPQFLPRSDATQIPICSLSKPSLHLRHTGPALGVQETGRRLLGLTALAVGGTPTSKDSVVRQCPAACAGRAGSLPHDT